MSNKNEVNKLIGVKSQYVLEQIFDYLSNFKLRIRMRNFFKYNERLQRFSINLQNKQINNRLSYIQNWTPYLKNIYSALSQVAEKVYNEACLEKTKTRVHYASLYKCAPCLTSNERKEAALDFERKLIESIKYILLVETIYLIQNGFLLDAINIKKNVSIGETVELATKNTLNKFLFSKNELRNTIDQLFSDILLNSSTSSGAKHKIRVAMQKHLLKRFPYWRKDAIFKMELCFLIVKIIWLKNNSFYDESIKLYNDGCYSNDCYGRVSFNDGILSDFELPDFFAGNRWSDFYNNYYEKFMDHMKENGDLILILFGQDFDVRAYFSEKLKSAIEGALSKQEEKNKFQQFLTSKEEPKKEQEGPKPNLEKQNSKDLNDEFNSK